MTKSKNAGSKNAGRNAKSGSGSTRVFKRPGVNGEPYPTGGSSLRARALHEDKPEVKDSRSSAKEAEKAEDVKDIKESKAKAPSPTEAVSGREADSAKENESCIRRAIAQKKSGANETKKNSSDNTWKKASAYSGQSKKPEDKRQNASKRKEKHTISKKALTAVLTVMAIVLAGAACVGLYYVSLVSKITVKGCERYTEAEIIDAAELYTGKCILTYDTGDIAKRLKADPYIDVISVKRVFPDEIEITMTERKEYAAIVTGSGTYCITDREGCILYAGRRESIEGLLPVYGLGTMGFSTGTYINKDKSKLRPWVLMELLDAFGERDAEISSVDLTIPASLKLTTNDGYTVMLGDSVDIAAKVERMFTALDKARASGSEGRIIYINSSGSADLSGGQGTARPTAEPTEVPSPTGDAAAADGTLDTASPDTSEEPTDTDAPDSTEQPTNTEAPDTTEEP